MSFSRFTDWLALRDYDHAVMSSRVAIIKRFARGNVTFQNGDILDDEHLDEIRASGDAAIKKLIAYRDATERHGKNHRI